MAFENKTKDKNLSSDERKKKKENGSCYVTASRTLCGHTNEFHCLHGLQSSTKAGLTLDIYVRKLAP